MISDVYKQLKQDEGIRYLPYRDSRGNWTIGVGHNLQTTDQSNVPKILWAGLSDEQIQSLLVADVSHLEAKLDVVLPWWNTMESGIGPRTGALLNMGFNLGAYGLCTFDTFLGYMHMGLWLKAADDLEYNTKVFQELPNRYGRIKQQILTGEWQWESA